MQLQNEQAQIEAENKANIQEAVRKEYLVPESAKAARVKAPLIAEMHDAIVDDAISCQFPCPSQPLAIAREVSIGYRRQSCALAERDV